jgi:hypothetical protein
MKKQRTKSEEKLGCSDYGVRDREQEGYAEENGSWVPGDKG